MSDVTRILWQIEQGDPQTAEKLLSLVYEELRNLAAAKLAPEKPGQTLQATALVQETYLRLAGALGSFENRSHFCGAAAEARRRIVADPAAQNQRHPSAEGETNSRLGLSPAIDAAIEELFPQQPKGTLPTAAVTTGVLVAPATQVRDFYDFRRSSGVAQESLSERGPSTKLVNTEDRSAMSDEILASLSHELSL